mgnify:CR=1 FL=1
MHKCSELSLVANMSPSTAIILTPRIKLEEIIPQVETGVKSSLLCEFRFKPGEQAGRWPQLRQRAQTATQQKAFCALSQANTYPGGPALADLRQLILPSGQIASGHVQLISRIGLGQFPE